MPIIPLTPNQPVLECQECGEVVRVLTDAEAQKVARDPYRYIVNCGPCGRALAAELESSGS